MPIVRPFRALRYDPVAVGGDLSAVICPPYDVISPAEREILLARHARNAVRIELPATGSERPERSPGMPSDDGYRAAAETLSGWRRDGTLRLDDEPRLYPYEQRYLLPGEGTERLQRGFFARLRLEPFGEAIRPHERTLSAPKEDRLRLLRATRTSTSPIVLLADDAAGRLNGALADVETARPLIEALDDGKVRHRVWSLRPDADAAAACLAVGDGRLIIADGHHRYETGLRYRDERITAGGAGADPSGDAPWNHLLALILPVGDEPVSPTILPTHRLLRDDVGPGDLLARWSGAFFTVTPRPLDELVDSFSPPFRAGGGGRFGLILPGGAYELVARRDAIDPLLDAESPEAVRRLDVALLEAALGRLPQPAESAVPAAAHRLAYTHDARAARRAVESGEASAAFLVDPTPVRDVQAVATAGALMPQKSTYFHPKAATGLVMYPHE